MNLIIFGPPGAGKGTQSSFISKKYNLYQLSTGEILREQIRRKTELGIKISPTMNSGSFVSDEIVSELIEKFIKDEKYKNKIIFDGYPRSLDQVKILENLLMKYKQNWRGIKTFCEHGNNKKRIAERRSLEKRTDDYDEIAIKRFKTYEKTTEPVIEYYKKINLLKVIDGERSIEQLIKKLAI